MIVQLAAVPARAKADCPAAFLRWVREMDSHRVVAAVSFAVRFSPGTGPFAVVLFCLSRFPICLATAGFVPAADPFGPAGFGLVAVAAAAVVVVAVDPFGLSDLSVAGLSVVAAGPGFVGLAVFVSDLAFSVCPFAVAALGMGMVAAVLFCSLTRQSSF